MPDPPRARPPNLELPPGIERLPLHRARLEAVCAAAAAVEGVVGMVIGGSVASARADAYSDLDLQLVVEETALERVVERLRDIADDAGPVVAAFTAEHVGHPRMLIVLYEDLVHVDLEPIALPDLATRNAGLSAVVLWSRDDRLASALPAERPQEDPRRQLDWFEARMWTWSWYVQAKILRGELYEALDGIQFIRDRVLFALLSMRQGKPASGSRRAEQRVGALAGRFAATIPTALTPGSVLSALREVMGLYVELADPLLEARAVPRAEAARAVVLRALEAGLSWRPDEPTTPSS